MSNALRYDALLVHYLARELDSRLAGLRIRALRFEPEPRRVTLTCDDAHLVFDLHASRGWIRLLTAPLEGGSAREVHTQRRARILEVRAPRDERWLEIEMDAGGADRAARVVVELMTNQWNAIALDAAGRVLAVLWPREAGDRALRVGRPYAPPAPAGRRGADEPIGRDEWLELLGPVARERRRSELIRSVAWTSPLNAWAILGPATESAEPDGASADLEEAWSRYRALAELPEARPRVLELDRPTPYPLPLPGTRDRPTGSLLEAIEACAGEAPPAGVSPELVAALEARRDEAARRADRLRAEAEAAPGKAAALRRQADLLMSQLHRVRKGDAAVELDDFEGGAMRLELDPARTPAENADALYTAARKRERAAKHLPRLVRDVVARQKRLDALLESLGRGDADPAELTRWTKEIEREKTTREQPERLPYRRYRSSGGLEIRVGQSSRANDELTFHHSSPNDIWLHARDVAGAHVILRWDDRDNSPPKRDLVEAAVLAALHSRARTSGAVPVDWTRRKYVRKARKAPPGTVLPERVATIFVEPDPELPERLAER